MKYSGRVSKFGEMQVLYNSSQCFVTLKIWEYAGLVEQCPRFASPDRISEVLAINTVLAKIRSSASQDQYFWGRDYTGGNGGRFRNQSG